MNLPAAFVEHRVYGRLSRILPQRSQPVPSGRTHHQTVTIELRAMIVKIPHSDDLTGAGSDLRLDWASNVPPTRNLFP